MISVITPTYRNGPELEVAIASLNEQTFQDWQHVIVADGPDPELRARLEKLGYKAHGKRIFMARRTRVQRIDGCPSRDIPGFRRVHLLPGF